MGRGATSREDCYVSLALLSHCCYTVVTLLLHCYHTCSHTTIALVLRLYHTDVAEARLSGIRRVFVTPRTEQDLIYVRY
jgi:hypothetical protein